MGIHPIRSMIVAATALALGAVPAGLSSADPSPSDRTERKAAQRQARLTAERLKKYD